MNEELIRLIENIHQEKGVDKEAIFQGIESALALAAKKYYRQKELPEVKIDRTTGTITASSEDQPIDPTVLGRIAAQTVKQIITQKIREAENMAIYARFEGKRWEILTGNVLQYEKGDMIVLIGKTEAILPEEEQIMGESYRIGQSVKALLLDIRRITLSGDVRIVLSRTHPRFVRRLFELEVPEVASGVVVIKEIVREAGIRTKIAVDSTESRVEPVGTCIGVKGARIKNVVEELAGEKIDVIKWDEVPNNFIKNSMKPAQVVDLELIKGENRAKVYVTSDQLSLAIGRKGQNIRLASRLTNWQIEVLVHKDYRTDSSKSTEPQASKGVDTQDKDEKTQENK